MLIGVEWLASSLLDHLKLLFHVLIKLVLISFRSLVLLQWGFIPNLYPYLVLVRVFIYTALSLLCFSNDFGLYRDISAIPTLLKIKVVTVGIRALCSRRTLNDPK